MSKSLLVIDTPECCFECKFLNDNYDYLECIITGETKGYNFRIHENIMEQCPLKPAPEYELVWYDDEKSDWERGYNVCLDEILGGNEYE